MVPTVRSRPCAGVLLMRRAWLGVLLVLFVGACSSTSDSQRSSAGVPPATPSPVDETPAREGTASPVRQAWFGDLHIHTQNSFDSIVGAVRATPDDAYRFAKGETLTHALGYPIRLESGALDFLAVTDHAAYLGVIPALADPSSPLGTHPLAEDVQSPDPAVRLGVFTKKMAVHLLQGEPVPGLAASDVIRSAWQETIDAAERHNDPGRFTTFVAFEYSSTPGGANLHRNVIFSGAEVPLAPFSSLDSLNPEDLWDWLDDQRAGGIEALAIPHNSLSSRGLMFERTDRAGAPIDAAYAAQRLRNEPLVELTQIQGTSETLPSLSPDDEWAGFEAWSMPNVVIGDDGAMAVEAGGPATGNYVREALRTGIELEESDGFNPYRFGLIGSTDTHNAASPVEEWAYFGQTGILDGAPENRGSVPAQTDDAITFFDQLLPSASGSGSGLAGVWAEENTRESIYAALRRKEVFATSGPRLRVRFFAGYGYSDTLEQHPEAIAQAYARGVPMGGTLVAQAGLRPKFLVWALRDPNEARLQRVQVVKGWIEDGRSQERVFDVACSDGLEPDARTHRCPDNGATVSLTTCSPSRDEGAVELRAVWSDPTFDPSQRAFYYARVLQNPTCRWSTWDAIRAGVTPSTSVPATLQERAWSSPISYAPQG